MRPKRKTRTSRLGADMGAAKGWVGWRLRIGGVPAHPAGGEMEAVGGDVRGEDAERLAHHVKGAVAVPDLAGVELPALGRCVEQPRVLAHGGGDGVFPGVDVVDVVHGGLLTWRMKGGSDPERSGAPP